MLVIGSEVQVALRSGQAVVALETAVLTHGLPTPTNLETMGRMAEAVRRKGAVPAVVGVLRGQLTVGVAQDEWPELLDDPWKCSVRDLAVAAVQGRNGGTTVAATAFLAARAGLKVFATGGVGGVHRGFASHLDISADLRALTETPLVVVSAGAKSVLDLAATLEVLETLSVPVIGYRTSAFPGFYVADSGLRLDRVVGSPAEVAGVRRAMDSLDQRQALLCVQPGPRPLDAAEVERLVADAMAELGRQGVHGKAVTPFLLDHLNRLSGQDLMRSNIELLVHNAELAADVAVALRR